jgi:glycosyltransferase involved in cell wall biosynthesis
MSQELLVSIIINNYNYGRFLKQAIDSAVHQTYCRTEVIVVDDGSTDNSREIIASYGDQIVPVLKENRGQASAFNAGFALSQGDIVIFLDSDDMLLPDTVQRVADVFQSNVDIAKVQYRLEVIDVKGIPTGTLIPSAYLSMPSGDLRQHVLQFPDDIPYSATSGNAFAARVLHQIFPVPEQIYGQVGADLYLYNLTPLFGIVISLEEIGGQYRIHESNNHYTSMVDLDKTRRIITRTYHTHIYLKKFANSLGLAGFPDEPADVLSVTFLAHRIISLKLDPLQHPIQGDALLQLFLSGVIAASRRVDVSLTKRLLYVLWFVAMAPAPRPLASWLAERFFYPETSGQFNTLFAKLQRV